MYSYRVSESLSLACFFPSIFEGFFSFASSSSSFRGGLFFHGAVRVAWIRARVFPTRGGAVLFFAFFGGWYGVVRSTTRRLLRDGGEDDEDDDEMT